MSKIDEKDKGSTTIVEENFALQLRIQLLEF